MNNVLIDINKMNMHITRHNETKLTWKPWTQVFNCGRGRAGGWELVQYHAKLNNMLVTEFCNKVNVHVYSKHVLLDNDVNVQTSKI